MMWQYVSISADIYTKEYLKIENPWGREYA